MFYSFMGSLSWDFILHVEDFLKHFCRVCWWSRVALICACLEMSLCLHEFILVNIFYIYLAQVEGGYACAMYIPGGQMKT